MQVPGEAVSLKIFLGERARSGHQPLYEAIVMKARERGMAGATVLRGPLGYGHSAKMHSAKILQLSDDLPVVIEIVDTAQKIDVFLPEIDGMMGATSGLVTLDKVQVLQYGTRATG
jgi:PII-like signaling protein